ncbi:hypothetical protein CAOG_06309 [Capsaspora owczarzaki ATCC 30864]|uniref:YdbS-like PH domain-containing protein n=1 Tax=Capsaspora owczarzaki (strain ATCC 30864) TaxID=595528 RepID=A0A0D2ULD6_CAPO3|nr:hypothetical protein CAOG_06309 [Capsaspora owczarzaki ATCC 30864]KJE95916.1 hypothetical protein CAOG_006309 [Capsaspora owczarzaki ATCC 30864]|eukprot:XP_004345058.1 hypothetical protein CAOG_06309 [Capsaspora owczarzaki ATCC 30864]
MGKFCPNCGKAADSGKFCGECGAAIDGGAASPSGSSAQAVAKVSVTTEAKVEGGDDIIWEGETWPKGCLSPMCCSATHWKISRKRIDITRGCCGSTMDTTDFRRVTDMNFSRSILQMCLNRGTITIFSSDATDPELKLTTWRMKALYPKLRDAWGKARIATSVDVPDHH